MDALSAVACCGGLHDVGVGGVLEWDAGERDRFGLLVLVVHVDPDSRQ